jgi:uncharacterized protein
MTTLSANLAAAAGAPLFKRFASSYGAHLLVVPHTRIFDLPAELAARIDARDPAAIHLVEALADAAAGEEPLDELSEPAPQNLSLNVSSGCNLACIYCYADRGSFKGAQPKPMSAAIARAAVDRLLAAADMAHPVTIGFLGGEPLVNRDLIHDVVRYAERRGRERGLDVRFSITTNATLLQPNDVKLFRDRRFAVTVSVDGDAMVQDAQRPRHGGRGSFAAMSRGIAPLLSDPGQAQIAARATVTRDHLDLERHFAAIRALGFRDVGFAPLRASPAGGALVADDWSRYLAALVRLARSELASALAGGSVTLANFAIALKQLHRGASAPYPCGAGGGYFSVSADGRWYACHRAIGAPDYELGDNRGLDGARRRQFLEQRHVHAQTDCRVCWARYLCSGGCHQEASARTRASCDFIRGWLEFCLAAYCELVGRRPGYFAASGATVVSEMSA